MPQLLWNAALQTVVVEVQVMELIFAVGNAGGMRGDTYGQKSTPTGAF